MPTPEPARTASGAPASILDAWALWLAVGWAVLLGLAALAQAFGWKALEDALDVRRLFR